MPVPVPTESVLCVYTCSAGVHPRWQTYVDNGIKKWSSIIINVVLGDPCHRPVLVVRYEDIKKNRTAEVHGICVHICTVTGPAPCMHTYFLDLNDSMHTIHAYASNTVGTSGMLSILAEPTGCI